MNKIRLNITGKMIHYSPTEFVSLPTYKDMNSLQFLWQFHFTSERQNINHKSRKSTLHKNYKLICTLFSEISIWSLRKHSLVLFGETLALPAWLTALLAAKQ